MGVQLVPRGRYPQAIAVLDAVCDKYPFNESFIAGQVLPWRARARWWRLGKRQTASA